MKESGHWYLPGYLGSAHPMPQDTIPKREDIIDLLHYLIFYELWKKYGYFGSSYNLTVL